MDTLVYIDGFNLYHGAVQFTAYKWLNLLEMCSKLLPSGHNIVGIKYFTATVSGNPDPRAPVRQQTYFRALRTLPGLEIVLGHFLAHPRWAPLAADPKALVRIVKTEEKGSDVNLATCLLVDGFQSTYDCAVVVSNDSDLAMPMHVVKNDLGKVVGLFNPHKVRASTVLRRQSDFIKQIRQGVLSTSQFPSVMEDAVGTFHRPTTWSSPNTRSVLPVVQRTLNVKVIP